MKVAIVIPAFNEATTITGVVTAVQEYGTPVVVDDCSGDDTGALAREAGAEVVRHSVNRGYDGALQSGFERAAELEMDIAVTFDADGQHTGATLRGVLAPLLEREAELVLGVRPKPARISEALYDTYARWRFGAGDILCGLKGYRMDLYHAHGRFDGVRSIGTELALASLKRGVPFVQVSVPIQPRKAGRTRFGSWLKGNWRIFRAMGVALWSDLRNDWGSNGSGHSDQVRENEA